MTATRRPAAIGLTIPTGAIGRAHPEVRGQQAEDFHHPAERAAAPVGLGHVEGRRQRGLISSLRVTAPRVHPSFQLLGGTARRFGVGVRCCIVPDTRVEDLRAVGRGDHLGAPAGEAEDVHDHSQGPRMDHRFRLLDGHEGGAPLLIDGREQAQGAQGTRGHARSIRRQLGPAIIRAPSEFQADPPLSSPGADEP